MGIEDLPARITSRIVANPGTGCWEWQGKLKNGYGRLHWEGRIWLVHRAVFTLLAEPIPDGLDLDHLCRVRHCVNPVHLEPVTRAVNVMRGEGPAAINAAKTHCDSGHEHNSVNTWIDKQGYRHCRPCHRERRREWMRDPANRAQHAETERARRRAAR